MATRGRIFALVKRLLVSSAPDDFIDLLSIFLKSPISKLYHSKSNLSHVVSKPIGGNHNATLQMKGFMVI